jgi:hypothetical protein
LDSCSVVQQKITESDSAADFERGLRIFVVLFDALAQRLDPRPTAFLMLSDEKPRRISARKRIASKP